MPRKKLKFYYVYVLRNEKDKEFYTGYTQDLERRFKEHNQGKTFSTKSREPFDIIYYEACLDREDAKQREKYLKSGIGKRYIKNRLKNYFKI